MYGCWNEETERETREANRHPKVDLQLRISSRYQREGHLADYHSNRTVVLLGRKNRYGTFETIFSKALPQDASEPELCNALVAVERFIAKRIDPELIVWNIDIDPLKESLRFLTELLRGHRPARFDTKVEATVNTREGRRTCEVYPKRSYKGSRSAPKLPKRRRYPLYRFTKMLDRSLRYRVNYIDWENTLPPVLPKLSEAKKAYIADVDRESKVLVKERLAAIRAAAAIRKAEHAAYLLELGGFHSEEEYRRFERPDWWPHSDISASQIACEKEKRKQLAIDRYYAIYTQTRKDVFRSKRERAIALRRGRRRQSPITSSTLSRVADPPGSSVGKGQGTHGDGIGSYKDTKELNHKIQVENHTWKRDRLVSSSSLPTDRTPVEDSDSRQGTPKGGRDIVQAYLYQYEGASGDCHPSSTSPIKG